MSRFNGKREVDVNVKKRWQDMYGQSNPFRLPQAIVKGVRYASRCAPDSPEESIDYLWIYLCSPKEESSVPVTSETPLSLDEWLAVVDEAACRGAKSVILTVTADVPDWDILSGVAHWAQSAYSFMVGIHFRGVIGDGLSMTALQRLVPEKTLIFVDDAQQRAAIEIRAAGLNVAVADGGDRTEFPTCCTLPERLACVDAEGELFTCGLVVGKDEYALGHVFDEMLHETMNDHTLPHAVPESASQMKHRCNGCPPLLAQRLHLK